MSNRNWVFFVLGILAAFFIVGFVIKLSFALASIVATILVILIFAYIIKRWLES